MKAIKVSYVENSTDYNLKLLKKYNRKVNQSAVKNLVFLMLKNGFSTDIIVIKTKAFGKTELFVADGQHRLEAVKSLKIPFTYKIVMAENPEEDTPENVCAYIADLNSSSRVWSPSRYLDTFAEVGKKEYVEMHKIKLETKLTLTDLQNIFLFGCGSKEVKEFKSGKMKFSDRDKSMKLKDAVLHVRNIIPNKSYVRRSFFKILKEVESKNYMRLAKAVADAAMYITKGNGEIPENETKFFEWLQKIHKETFPRLSKVLA